MHVVYCRMHEKNSTKKFRYLTKCILHFKMLLGTSNTYSCEGRSLRLLALCRHAALSFLLLQNSKKDVFLVIVDVIVAYASSSQNPPAHKDCLNCCTPQTPAPPNCEAITMETLMTLLSVFFWKRFFFFFSMAALLFSLFFSQQHSLLAKCLQEKFLSWKWCIPKETERMEKSHRMRFFANSLKTCTASPSPRSSLEHLHQL